jgi:peptidoglycan/LPS O-acetylase OafA/YrhL
VLWTYGDVFGFASESLLFAMLIVQMNLLSSTRSCGWTEWPPITFLGRISIRYISINNSRCSAVRHASEAYPVIVQLLAAISMTVVLATISHYLIERPFLSLDSRSPQQRKRLVYEAARS